MGKRMMERKRARCLKTILAKVIIPSASMKCTGGYMYLCDVGGVEGVVVGIGGDVL